MVLGDVAHRSGDIDLIRRRLIRFGAFAAVGTIIPSPVFAAIRHLLPSQRSLSLYNSHTEESLETTYWSDGHYLPKALAGINYIMRDHHSGKIRPIDTRLLDLLHVIAKEADAREPFHIISGYRSPETNAFLRTRRRGIAKHSLHILGKAVDIQLPGVPLTLLHRVALDLEKGGVGYYPGSNFIHVDVGRTRHWQFPKHG